MGCLALNASFEPLTIVPARRAVRLVLDGKAEVLEADAGRGFRSVHHTVPFPTVIRLVRYVHVPRRFRRQVTNTFLFARDDYACVPNCEQVYQDCLADIDDVDDDDWTEPDPWTDDC